MKTKVINFYGGPSSGKSTSACDLVAKLKNSGVNAELVTEVAKDEVLSENVKMLEDQILLFARQHHRMQRLVGKYDVIVTDSPLIMGLAYTKEDEVELSELIIRKHRENFDNFNIWVNRSTAYNPIGRTQTEEGAKLMDKKNREYTY